MSMDSDIKKSNIDREIASLALDELFTNSNLGTDNVINLKSKSISSINEYHDINSPLNPESFPDKIQSGRRFSLPTTINNLSHLLRCYGITAIYDEALKSQELIIPSKSSIGHDLHNESCMQQLCSLAAMNDMKESIVSKLPVIMTANTINPIKDFIFSKRWDGVSRIPSLCNSLVVEEHNRDLSSEIIRTWLIQCVAALDRAEIGCAKNHSAVAKFELILVLQGSQGMAKTKWFTKLLPYFLNGSRFSNRYIKDGSNLVLDNKDSIKQNLSCWINELGELDATFRKSDIAQLKAFCSTQSDTLRLPYAKTECSFKRSTSFCGSVNDKEFLNDATGSRRFGVIKLESILDHKIDMQQLWAEVWELYAGGAEWWISKEIETLMQERNLEHQTINPIEDGILTKFNWGEPNKLWFNRLTVTEIYQQCFDKKPNQRDLNSIKPVLEKKGVQLIKSHGVNKYLMPQLNNSYAE